MIKTKSKKEALEDRLGAVLGRSWVVLGAVLGSFFGVFYWNTEGFVKIHVFEKVRCQEATWAEVEPKWSPRGSQDGAQEGAKTSPRGGQDGAKNEKNSEVKLSRVSVCLGRVKGKRCEVVTRPLEEKGRLVGKLPPAVR